MERNRNHPIMQVLMVLRNGPVTKLEEGYISNPDWMCLVLSLCPDLTADEADVLGKEWRDVTLTSLFRSADRCHAMDYECTKTHGRPPNSKKPTPLYFYPSIKKGRKQAYALTRLGEARARELSGVILQANTDFPRPMGPCSEVFLPGQRVKMRIAACLMSHFHDNMVDDYATLGTSRFGAAFHLIPDGEEVLIVRQLSENVILVASRGKEGFLSTFSLVHPKDTIDLNTGEIRR